MSNVYMTDPILFFFPKYMWEPINSIKWIYSASVVCRKCSNMSVCPRSQFSKSQYMICFPQESFPCIQMAKENKMICNGFCQDLILLMRGFMCGARGRVVKDVEPEVKASRVRFPQSWSCIKFLCKLWIYFISGHPVVMGTKWNAKLVLCEWLQLLKTRCILPKEMRL